MNATKEELTRKRDELLEQLRKNDAGRSVYGLVTGREERRRIHAELDEVEIALEQLIDESR